MKQILPAYQRFLQVPPMKGSLQDSYYQQITMNPYQRRCENPETGNQGRMQCWRSALEKMMKQTAGKQSNSSRIQLFKHCLMKGSL